MWEIWHHVFMNLGIADAVSVCCIPLARLMSTGREGRGSWRRTACLVTQINMVGEREALQVTKRMTCRGEIPHKSKKKL